MSRVLPILFNTEMVRAILDGRKTVTRRIIKGNVLGVLNSPYHKEHPEVPDKVLLKKLCNAPYQRGDILYVRETWNYVYNLDDNDQIVEDTGRYVYYADDSMPFLYWTDPDTGEHKDRMPWKPSIHMPKDAARIWLRVTDVRVERLQDMGTRDYIAEGAKDRHDFIIIWDSTVKDKEYSWYGNPWVWVIEFERCEKPEEVK